MSETMASSTTAPATEPVATSAHEATADPVRTNATKDLTPESRPELTDATSALPAGTSAGTTTTTGAVDDVPKGMAVVESQPINEGVLAYKQPGLVKSLMYSKKFFWFTDEPVEHKHLADYLRGEKATDVARPNAAHASHTGKGLLFFAKRAEDKPQPQGIINLADIKDVAKTGPTEFNFKYHAQKHAFQATNTAERDGWLVALESRHTEAMTDRDAVTGSEGYKSSLDKFSKPGAFAAAPSTSRSLSRHKKTADSKPAEGSGAPVTSGVGNDSASSSDEAKASNAKSRSQSRKRSSMFGALLGKKEQHDEKKELKKEDKEEKKEEKVEEKAIKAEVKKEEKAEKHAEKEERKEEKLLTKEEKKAPKSDGVVEPKPLDAAAVGKNGNPVVPLEGTSVESPKTEEPLAAAGTPAEPSATTVEPSANTAEPSAASTLPRETAPKANKRNSIFGNFFAKKETPAATSPSATTPANETAPIVPAKDTEPAPVSHVAPQPEASATETVPTLDSNAPAPTTEATSATTPTTSPMSPDTAKANRRTSFFSNLGTKKEKRSGGVSDAEGTDGEGKKSGGFGGLLRKASRAQGPRSASKPAATLEGATESEAAAPISKDATTTGTTGTTSGENVPESTLAASQQTPVQAAA
ncbi:MAG: hypothetical protein Q9168_002339 [Polycauliona sp. 1 TL-2023]